MYNLKTRWLLLILLAPSVMSATAQNAPDPTDEAISEHAADSIARKSFATMVAGTESITSVANYVSFVPTDGKFTIAGNSFFKTRNNAIKPKRPYEYFALGLTGSGSIVGGTVATLFDQGKFNTGTDLGLRLSWRMNVPNVGSISPENQQMIDKRNALYRERQQKIDIALNEIAGYEDKARQSTLKLSALRRKAKTLTIDVDTAGLMALINDRTTPDSTRRKFVDSLRTIKAKFAVTGNKTTTLKITVDTLNLRTLTRLKPLSNDKELNFLDSLITLKAKLFKNEQAMATMQQDSVILQELVEVAAIKKNTRFQDRTRRQKDLSAKYGLDRIGISYADTVASKINWEYRAKIEAVELSRPIQGMRINWLSVIGNWNRRSYRTYDAALAFQDAITKHYFDGFTAGLQLNFYTIYKPVQQASLFNIGLLAKKTNNLDDLTATKLTDETTVVNGGQTRKSTDEYNVYTNPVEIYNTIQLPVNYYNFFGKGLAYGWHVYGLADLRSTGKNVLDAGAGFIFGLNTADAKRLFNIELFATYKDINRTLVEDKTTSKWRQLQIGFSVAIPFMLYK